MADTVPGIFVNLCVLFVPACKSPTLAKNMQIRVDWIL